jgi:hypothetical protein
VINHWPSKGPMQVYLCSLENKLHYAESRKVKRNKTGLRSKEKHESKAGDMPYGGSEGRQTKNWGEGSK